MFFYYYVRNLFGCGFNWNINNIKKYSNTNMVQFLFVEVKWKH